MGFEVFEKRMVPLAKAPAITIQKRGIFSINRAAHNLIGGAETVELLYDKVDKIIGIRPIDETSPHAYTVRAQSPNGDSGQMILSATAFTQYYDIDTDVSRRWVPYEKDGILCIDLKGSSTVIIGHRTKREPEEPEGGSED